MKRGPQSFVLDASVAINLLATGCLREMIHGLAASVVITRDAQKEVIVDPLSRKKTAGLLTPFFTDGTLVEHVLAGAARDVQVDLVGADPPDDLGDGEAASIAYGLHHDSVVVLDEAKAARICREQYPSLEVRSTIDLIRDPRIGKVLGVERLADATYRALRHSRMRVPPPHLQWVVDLIGPVRAAECPSLRTARVGQKR